MNEIPSSARSIIMVRFAYDHGCMLYMLIFLLFVEVV